MYIIFYCKNHFSKLGLARILDKEKKKKYTECYGSIGSLRGGATTEVW